MARRKWSRVGRCARRCVLPGCSKQQVLHRNRRSKGPFIPPFYAVPVMRLHEGVRQRITRTREKRPKTQLTRQTAPPRTVDPHRTRQGHIARRQHCFQFQVCVFKLILLFQLIKTIKSRATPKSRTVSSTQNATNRKIGGKHGLSVLRFTY